MKIGIVVHGPNIIDSGYALKIIDILENFGEVYCKLGGTMGRTAVIDAYLEDKIDISTKRLPSESLTLFLEEGMDIIFILNYGKSSITGHTFGYKVFSNVSYNAYNKNKDNEIFSYIPVIQIERPGENDGSIISWNDINTDLAIKLSKILDLKLLDSESIKNQYIERKLKGLKGEKDSKEKNDDEKIRYIHGVSPNENIFVNGIVIGKSNSETLSLVSKNGIITDIIGGTIKDHGVEKLGSIDIEKAVVKTGILRKSKPKPRIMNDDIRNSDNILNRNFRRNYLRIAFLDHAAEDIYNLKNFDLTVTIGDDTTLIASDILYRFNIPIIGIIDGDLDKVVESGYIANNSTIIELKSGFDDIVGKSIFEEIFNSKNYIDISIDNIDDSKDEKIEDFKNEILEIVNNITSEYIIKSDY